MSRKVVDTNQLRCALLRGYLARSPHNIAVLPDYTAMEAYKGETLTTIYASMEILTDFPHQVIVLKGTQRVCGLSGRAAGLTRRLIDEEQTAQFRTFGEHIKLARAGNQNLQAQLLERNRDANDFLDGPVLRDAAEYLPRMRAVMLETFTPDQLSALRSTPRRFNRAMADRLLACVCRITGALFQSHPTKPRLPRTFAELRNTFLFRFALCTCTHMIEWILTGADTAKHPTKVRNDMVDIGIASYATFFDGLLSDDGKATRVYDHADVILKTVLASPHPSWVTTWFGIAETAAGTKS